MTAYESASFAAMGTEVEVMAAPALPPGAVDRVRALFCAVESRLSRFKPDSELSCLNRAAGQPFRASALLAAVLSDAIDASRRTGRLVNPLLLSQIEAAGYTETIESVRGSVRQRAASAPCAPDWEIRLEPDGTVAIPLGTGVDLGGFAKGWTVDLASERMAPADNWLINAGGDLLARGEGPDGGGWTVGVEDPFAPDRCVATLAVRNGAVATSSTMRRRWWTQEGDAHHLIDPRTGLPSETGLASVTVVAQSVAAAEVTAKHLLLLGVGQAQSHAEADNAAALLVSVGGGVFITPAMEGFIVR
jgi:thiamine biosynthesis lipoprotein